MTELLQYPHRSRAMPLKAESEALLAGTCWTPLPHQPHPAAAPSSAAAYLRRRGGYGGCTADVPELWFLQSTSPRYDIIRRRAVPRRHAIAALDQSATGFPPLPPDEMLTLQGVRASSQLYRKDDGGIYIPPALWGRDQRTGAGRDAGKVSPPPAASAPA